MNIRNSYILTIDMMRYENKSQNIVTLATCLTGLQMQGITITDVVLSALKYYQELDSFKTYSSASIKASADLIQAYLELGFSYLDHKDLFDDILQKAGYTNEQINSFQLKNKPVIASPNSIRSLIGRWPASPHNSHKINDAVSDIINHVKKGDPGVYIYYTAKPDGRLLSLYRLTISYGSAILHDTFNNTFYSLLDPSTHRSTE